MPADGAETIAITPDPGPTIHGIAPVLVAEGEDVDELVRTARAGVAVLSLHLRNAQHEATLAAGESSGWDLQAAKQFLTSTVEQQTRARRLEMAQELEQARTDAARLVLATRADAAALIESAGERALDVLLAGTVTGPAPGRGATVPSLRVVTEAPAPPASDDLRPAVAPHAAPVANPAPAPPPPAVASPAPVRPDPTASVAPVMDQPAAVVPEPAPDPVAVPAPVMGLVAEQPVPAVVGAAPAPDLLAATGLVAAQVAPVVPAPTLDVTPAGARRSSPLGRFLYVDVLLPMIAVLVLLVVLLAWVG